MATRMLTAPKKLWVPEGWGEKEAIPGWMKVPPARKDYSASLEILEGERAVIFKINTAAVDRDNEVLLPSGADLKPYLDNNRVVMWCHNYSMPPYNLPIGTSQWVKKTKEWIIAKALFAERELYEFADQVYRLYAADPPLLNMCSVGFCNAIWEEITEKDLKQHPEWAGAERKAVKWEFLEFSCVPIGSNRDALALARGKGLAVPAQVADYYELLPPKSEILATIETMGDAKSESKAKYNCECIKCGHKVTSEKHCKDIKCPKCGAEMRRVERPGPGRTAEEAEAKEALEPPESKGTEILKAEGQKPLPNEHSCGLAADEDFDKYVRKNCEQKHNGKCIDVMYGIKDGKSTISSLRYKTDAWTKADARAHCKTRKGRFIAATRSLEPPSESELEVVDKLVEQINAVVLERVDAKLAEFVAQYKEARQNRIAENIVRRINVERIIEEKINEARGRV